MPKPALLLLFLLLSSFALAQRTEISLHLNGGLFAFTGDRYNGQSPLIQYDWAYRTDYYANDPYGGKFGLSYGVAAQVARVTRGKALFGLQSGYELLRSRVAIDSYYAFRTTATYPAEGNVFLGHHFVNVHPFAGYRLLNKTITLD